MTQRDPHSDNELIDEAIDEDLPSQTGSSGGDLARSVGSRDEEKTACGGSLEPTGVHKSDKPDDDAAPGTHDGSGLG